MFRVQLSEVKQFFKCLSCNLISALFTIGTVDFNVTRPFPNFYVKYL